MNKQKILFELKNFVPIRIACYPFMTLYRYHSKKKYIKSEDRKKMMKFQNIHEGCRCFIIGNGPSLMSSDLDKLKNEICFGTNRIYHIFNQTEWRPTYYMASDMDVIAEEKRNIMNTKLNKKFIVSYARRHMGNAQDINYFFVDTPFMLIRSNFKSRTLNDDVSEYFSSVGTTSCLCVQLAIYMGFKEIYLVGMDNNYPVEIDDYGRRKKNDGVKAYFKGMQGGEQIAITNVRWLTESFSMCRKYADAHNIKIYNATRGGKLEVFGRVDFDDIIANNH